MVTNRRLGINPVYCRVEHLEKGGDAIPKKMFYSHYLWCGKIFKKSSNFAIISVECN